MTDKLTIEEVETYIRNYTYVHDTLRKKDSQLAPVDTQIRFAIQLAEVMRENQKLAGVLAVASNMIQQLERGFINDGGTWLEDGKISISKALEPYTK